jgi:hypothetical protein
MEPNAILAVSSLDRYNTANGQSAATTGDALIAQYSNEGQPCNNFTIFSPGNLIYGYIKKIQISQIQLQYHVPTIVPDKNDGLWIANQIQADFVTIPHGFYTPAELAAGLEILLNNTNVGNLSGGITVAYSSEDGFTFTSAGTGPQPEIAFPTLEEIETITASVLNYDAVQNALRTYRLLGINVSNATLGLEQKSSNTPIFLYTPYVDICSEVLTKYQKIKDTNTAAQKLNTIVARVFLSGVSPPVALSTTNFEEPLGTYPFVVVQDCNTPKVIRWSREETVTSLDFQLRDQYGELLFTKGPGSGNSVYFTEFQMTLMCIEGER